MLGQLVFNKINLNIVDCSLYVFNIQFIFRIDAMQTYDSLSFTPEWDLFWSSQTKIMIELDQIILAPLKCINTQYTKFANWRRHCYLNLIKPILASKSIHLLQPLKITVCWMAVKILLTPISKFISSTLET